MAPAGHHRAGVGAGAHPLQQLNATQQRVVTQVKAALAERHLAKQLDGVNSPALPATGKDRHTG